MSRRTPPRTSSRKRTSACELCTAQREGEHPNPCNLRFPHPTRRNALVVPMYTSLVDLNIALFSFWKKDEIVHDYPEERNNRRIISMIVLNVIYIAVIHRPKSRLKRKATNIQSQCII